MLSDFKLMLLLQLSGNAIKHSEVVCQNRGPGRNLFICQELILNTGPKNTKGKRSLQQMVLGIPSMCKRM